MSVVTRTIANALGIAPDSASRIIASAITVVAVLVVRWVLLWIVGRRTQDSGMQYRWRKWSAYVAAFAGIIVLGRIWFSGVQSLVTYLGLVSAGVAIALREPIANVFGWIFLSSRRSFVVGDRIPVADFTGDVIDISVSTFSLLEVAGLQTGEQASGRIIHVPNGVILSQPVANYTQGFNYIWNEIPITVTFESDWERAKTLLQSITSDVATDAAAEAEKWISRAGRYFFMKRDAVSPTVYSRIVGDGIELTLRYMCEPQRRRSTTQEICERVLRAFAAEDGIDFAYKTTRIFRQSEEGKGTLKSRVLGEEDNDSA